MWIPYRRKRRSYTGMSEGYGSPFVARTLVGTAPPNPALPVALYKALSGTIGISHFRALEFCLWDTSGAEGL